MENRNKEQREREIYEQSYAKQAKLSKRILLIVFGGLGLLFLVMGIVLLSLGIVDEEGFNPGFVFAPIGGCFLLLAIIFAFMPVKPTQASYDKFKSRTAKYGYYMNSYDLMIKLEMLEKRVEELEKQVNSDF